VAHSESLARKELCPEMSEMMDAVTRIVNYIKTRPLKSKLLADLCKKMGNYLRTGTNLPLP
jgi:hypothetical protein